MKCKAIIFTLMTIPFMFGGCQKKDGYPFFHARSEITTIKIVGVTNSLVYEDLEITTLYVIDEKEQFLEEFSAIQCNHIFGYAYAVHEDVPDDEVVQAIKFEYANGDFELIAVPGPGIARYSVEGYWAGENYNPVAGTYVLDSEELVVLVEKYSRSVE